MRVCHVVEILTPKKVSLNGLWWGDAKARRVVIWVHGLGSSAFSKLDIVEKIAGEGTAVITFNNRGHHTVARIPRGDQSIVGGAAFERFTECIDDIQGAVNFAKRGGAKEIYLAGHSTGCQKSIYWASKKGKGVKGIVLLAPISDYTGGMREKRYAQALKEARSLTHKRNSFAFVKSWRHPITAQRFMSLYSGTSAEEVFPYWDAARAPRALRSVTVPLLVLLAAKDEYADRPAKKIQDWFAEHIKVGDQIAIIPGVKHGFKGQEALVARMMRAWMRLNSRI